MENSRPIDAYIARQLPRNYVCELVVNGECVSLITVSKHGTPLDKAKKIFRKEAVALKEAENLESVALRIHHE